MNQVTLPSINLEAGVAFYRQLGLTLIVDSIPRYARLACPDGGSTLSLHQVASMPVGPRTIVYFECTQLEEKVKELKSKGVTFLTELTDQSWLWKEIKLQDPDGNPIIFYRAGENRLNPPWRI